MHFFLQAASGAPFSPAARIVSIGPVTSETLREHGLEPHVEARRHNIAGVIDAVLEDAAEHAGEATPAGAGASAAQGNDAG